MSERIQNAGIWGTVICSACSKGFEVATAIDEMFVLSDHSAYSLWTGGKLIFRPLTVTSGKTHLIDIRGIFDEVYLISPAFEKIRWLAGGCDIKYLQQGYVMVSIAPFPNEETVTLKGGCFIEGRTMTQPKLSSWKSVLLKAKLVMHESPELTIILAVNAVDLYIEELTGCEIGSSRPGSWSKAIKCHLNKSLKELIHHRATDIQDFVQLRNDIAHGRDYLFRLPRKLQRSEDKWLEMRHQMEDPTAFSPCSAFALRNALAIIRCCQRYIDNGKYIGVFV